MEGDNYELNCFVAGTSRPAKIKWTKLYGNMDDNVVTNGGLLRQVYLLHIISNRKSNFISLRIMSSPSIPFFRFNKARRRNNGMYRCNVMLADSMELHKDFDIKVKEGETNQSFCQN